MPSTAWWMWTVGLGAGFPLLVVLLGELSARLEVRWPGWAKVVRLVRTPFLPALALLLLASRILELDSASTTVRIISTGFWILAIHLGLAAANVGLFSRTGDGDPPRVPDLFRDIVRFLLVAAGAAVVLSTVWGADLGGVLAALGVGSIVIGLALQETLGNLMAGIALLFEKPFRPGDYIVVGDKEGWISETNWRAVRLLTRDGDLLVIPNSVLGREIIANMHQPERTNVERITLGFSYDDPPNLVKEVMTRVARETPGILHDPPPRVITTSYDDFSIGYELVFAIPDYNRVWGVRDEFLSRVWYAARRAELEIPFPIRTLERRRERPRHPLHERIGGLVGFRQLDEEQRRTLTHGARVLEFGAREPVLERGSKTDALHVVLAGEVRLEVSGQDGARTIATLERGDVLGQESLLRGQSLIATARAGGDVQVLVLTPEASQAFLEWRPDRARVLDASIDRLRREAARRMEQGEE